MSLLYTEIQSTKLCRDEDLYRRPACVVSRMTVSLRQTGLSICLEQVHATLHTAAVSVIPLIIVDGLITGAATGAALLTDAQLATPPDRRRWICILMEGRCHLIVFQSLREGVTGCASRHLSKSKVKVA